MRFITVMYMWSSYEGLTGWVVVKGSSIQTMVRFGATKSVLWSSSFAVITTIFEVGRQNIIHTMSGTIFIEKIKGHDVSEEMIARAAELFSSDYGIWGPLAEEKSGTFGNFCKPGMYIIFSR